MQSINIDLLNYIMEEIKDNKKITEVYLANKYGYSERTIRRYIKILKDQKKIKLKTGKNREWILYK